MGPFTVVLKVRYNLGLVGYGEKGRQDGISLDADNIDDIICFLSKTEVSIGNLIKTVDRLGMCQD